MYTPLKNNSQDIFIWKYLLLSHKSPGNKYSCEFFFPAESKRQIVQSPSVQSSSVQASRVQVSRRPESKCPGVQSPSIQRSRVQVPRVQASKRPESKCPGVHSPSVQRPRVQACRVQASRPCLQSPGFLVCPSQGSTNFLGKYYFREYLNVKIPYFKPLQVEYLFPSGNTYLLVNKEYFFRRVLYTGFKITPACKITSERLNQHVKFDMNVFSKCF